MDSRILLKSYTSYFPNLYHHLLLIIYFIFLTVTVTVTRFVLFILMAIPFSCKGHSL